MDLNNISITGRLVRDPEMYYTSQGTAILKLSVACDRTFNKQYPKTSFFNIEYFGKAAAGLSQYLVKGKMVSIIGEMEQKSYTDKNTQKKVYYWILNSKDIQMISTGQNNQQQQNQSNDWKPSNQNNQPGPGLGPGPANQQNNNYVPANRNNQPEAIQDPWGDSGNQSNQGFNPNSQPFNPDDDIPF